MHIRKALEVFYSPAVQSIFISVNLLCFIFMTNLLVGFPRPTFNPLIDAILMAVVCEACLAIAALLLLLIFPMAVEGLIEYRSSTDDIFPYFNTNHACVNIASLFVCVCSKHEYGRIVFVTFGSMVALIPVVMCGGYYGVKYARSAIVPSSPSPPANKQ